MNDKYDLILEKIEKEIDNVFPNNVTNKWIFNAVGKIETDISCQAADNINIPGLDLIKRGGKRWRPLVLVLINGCFNKNNDIAYKLSPLVEIIHNGTLLIDDIEDKAIERRGDKAIHLIYGDDMAINSGNHMYFIPTLIIEELNLNANQKIQIYQSYCKNMRRLHFGQGLDIQWHNNLNYIPTINEYIQMCKFKTGCLASLSGELGAIIAGLDENKIEEIRVIWENIGVGFQILDDIKNLTTGNPGKLKGDDIVEGKKSLPVIIHCNENQKIKLLHNISKAKKKGIIKGQKYINRAINILESSGSIEKSKIIANDLIKSSLNNIKLLLPDSIEKELLIKLVENF